MKFTHISTQSLFSVVFVSKVTSLGLTGSKKATIVILFFCYELGSLVEMSVNAQMNKENFYNLHNVRTPIKEIYLIYNFNRLSYRGSIWDLQRKVGSS